MIPVEAVEAAAKRLYVLENQGRSACQFDSLPQSELDARIEMAQHALEAAAPYMPQQITTAVELDTLPRFTVIRSAEGSVFERQTMWHEAGSRDLMYSPDVALPATVLQLGWGEE